MSAQVLGNQLCEYCHQKPRFSNHSYCSKTCAAQAATLCDYCHKKPKFQGFEYCGKNCAAQAKPAGRNPRAPGASGASGNQPAPNVGGSGKYNQAQQRQQQQQPLQGQAAPIIDPVQLAKLVVPYIPQVAQAFFASGNPPTAPSNAPTGPTPQVVPPKHTSNNPFLGGIPATQQNLDNNGLNQQTADNLRCLIPGCGKPVHVDAKGVKISDYCSLRHREEAVTSGLMSPCIMCLSYPQSDTDYFCSRACREESLNKNLQYDYCDEEQTVVSESEGEET